MTVYLECYEISKQSKPHIANSEALSKNFNKQFPPEPKMIKLVQPEPKTLKFWLLLFYISFKISHVRTFGSTVISYGFQDKHVGTKFKVSHFFYFK